MMNEGYGMIGSPWMMLVVAVLVVVPVWRICTKAGYSGWLSLLILVPIVNLVLLYFLAFAEWPLERRDSPVQT